MGSAPVAAVAAEFLDDRAPAGGFVVRTEKDGSTSLCYVCPCACGDWRCLPVTTGVKAERAWLWDGDRETPTLTPSIRHLDRCRFHGFLTAGVWTFCGDSGS